MEKLISGLGWLMCASGLLLWGATAILAVQEMLVESEAMGEGMDLIRWRLATESDLGRSDVVYSDLPADDVECELLQYDQETAYELVGVGSLGFKDKDGLRWRHAYVPVSESSDAERDGI